MSILPSFGIVKLRILELDTWASEHSVFFSKWFSQAVSTVSGQTGPASFNLRCEKKNGLFAFIAIKYHDRINLNGISNNPPVNIKKHMENPPRDHFQPGQLWISI